MLRLALTSLTMKLRALEPHKPWLVSESSIYTRLVEKSIFVVIYVVIYSTLICRVNFETFFLFVIYVDNLLLDNVPLCEAFGCLTSIKLYIVLGWSNNAGVVEKISRFISIHIIITHNNHSSNNCHVFLFTVRLFQTAVSKNYCYVNNVWLVLYFTLSSPSIYIYIYIYL